MPGHRLTDRLPLAVIGIGCRFPGGARDPESFWKLLATGTSAIVDVPPDRWNRERFFDPDLNCKGKSHVQRGGFLCSDPALFEPEAFGISPREAPFVDPQQRLLLEVTWEALENACLPVASLEGSNTGVFVGGFTLDYMMLQMSAANRELISSHTASGVSMTMLSSRISHSFDLRGPCLSVDTACSSSLMATHLACQSLWNGESSLALAGGVNSMLLPDNFIAMSKGQFLSADGLCKTFDASADGYARAEGAGVIVLCQLDKAVREGRRIWALVNASAANQDGRTPGITLPSLEAQTEVLGRAYDSAGLSPAQVAYVEAHGTGTAAGDPVEVAAIGAVIGAARHASEPCLVGSVKANIGHLEAASGVAGMIKAALCLNRHHVPPQIHLKTLSERASDPSLHIKIPTEPAPLADGPIVAGVNSFGYGGTNVHIVMSSPPPPTRQQPQPHATSRPHVLVISAKSAESLKAQAKQYASFLRNDDEDLFDVCRTAALHRSHYSHRLAVWGEDREALLERLEEATLGVVLAAPSPVFLFSGMGAQYTGMGMALEQEPVYAESLKQWDDMLRSAGSVDWRSVVSQRPVETPIEEPQVAQPANLAMQMALARLLESWGVRPGAALGHSVGEMSAAICAGVLRPQDGVRLCALRSNLQQPLHGNGAMLAAALSPDEASDLLRDHSEVALAAINGRNQVTLSGPTEAIHCVASLLEQSNVHHTLLKVQTAYHSPQLATLAEAFLPATADIRAQEETRLPFYSTVSGARRAADQFGLDHWWRNVLQPVAFADALDAALGDGHRVFVELGPHPVLSAFLQDAAADREIRAAAITTVRRGANDRHSLAETVCQLYRAGCEIDLAAYYGPGNVTELPAKAWNRSRYWNETGESARQRLGQLHSRLLQEPVEGPLDAWTTRFSPEQVAYLSDHVVAGAAVVPGAVYMEMALQAGRAIFGNEAFQVDQLSFEKLADLEDGDPVFRLVVAVDRRQFSIYREPKDDDWQLCCQGVLRNERDKPLIVAASTLSSIPAGEPLDLQEVYRALKRYGLEYGPAFQTLKSINRLNDGQVVARLELPSHLDARGHAIHPVLIDGGLQSLIAAVGSVGEGSLFPVAIGGFRQFQPVGDKCLVHAKVVRQTATTIRADLDFFAMDGQPLAIISDAQFRRVPAPQEAFESRLKHWLYGESWAELELAVQERPVADGWRILSSDSPLDLRPGSRLLDLRFAAAVKETTGPEFAASCLEDAAQLLTTLQALVRSGARRYVLVTQQAHAPLPGDASHAVRQAGLVAIAHAAMIELPDLHVKHFDFDIVPQHVEEILQLEAASGEERAIAVRDGKFLAPRVVPVEPKFVRHEVPLKASPDETSQLEAPQRGRFDTLCFRPRPRRQPAAGEIELQMQFAPLAFKDVMKVLDLLPDDVIAGTLIGEALGMEGSGQVARLGPGVVDFAVGDWAYAIAPNTLQSFVTLPTEYAVRIPDDITPVDLTSLSVYMTAYHGLVDHARLRRGETVLIHNGSGGVGLAAIEVTRHCGGHIITTAGNEEKRAFLREQRNIEHVSDSRSRAFVDDVKRWTDGRGVDVVIGSLPAEATPWNLQCLARFGRYIELGKAGFDGRHPLDMTRFSECLSMIAVDLDKLLANRVDEGKRLSDEVVSGMSAGRFPPLPTEVFPACHVDQAFSKMARARHIGKIVIELNDPGPRMAKSGDPLFRRDATYLVTGASSGFGRQVAIWLAQNGAGQLVLLSRRGPDAPDVDSLRREIEDCGGRADILSCDVSDRQALQQVLHDLAARGAVLRGVFHAAMVLDDKWLVDMDRASLERVFAPKAAGAWHLHELTSHLPLDYMVFFSSVASLFGNFGQGNYAAANLFLDALAQHRKTRGLPGLSINWGIFGETGVAARNTQLAAQLARAGVEALSTADALEALDRALRQQRPRLGIVNIDWARWRGAAGQAGALTKFAEVARLAGDQRVGVRADLARLDSDALQATIEQQVRQVAAKVLGCDADRLSPQASFQELGLDSLMLMEVVALLHERLGVLMKTTDILSASSIERVVALIVNTVRPAQPTQSEEPTSGRQA